MHIHLHAHTYLNPNTHIHTLTHIQTNPNTLTFTHTHIHTYTHTLSRTLTHTRSFQFCWRLKLTLEVNVGLRLVTSPCCLSPCVCTCRFPPPHSLLVSSWRLFMVCPPHSCSAQDGGPGSQYRASRAGLGSPWSTSLLPPLPVPRGLRPSSYWGLLESSPCPLSHRTTSLGMAASASLRPLPPPLSLLGDCHRESIQKCPVAGLKFLLDISHLD